MSAETMTTPAGHEIAEEDQIYNDDDFPEDREEIDDSKLDPFILDLDAEEELLRRSIEDPNFDPKSVMGEATASLFEYRREIVRNLEQSLEDYKEDIPEDVEIDFFDDHVDTNSEDALAVRVIIDGDYLDTIKHAFLILLKQMIAYNIRVPLRRLRIIDNPENTEESSDLSFLGLAPIKDLEERKQAEAEKEQRKQNAKVYRLQFTGMLVDLRE